MDDFKIKRITVNYIYSFLPATKELIYDESIINSLSNSKTFDNSEVGGGKPNISLEKEDPRNRIGLSSYLAIKSLSGFELIEPITAKLNSIDIKIFPLFRFFPHGSSLDFQIVGTKEKNNIIIEEAYPFMHLASTEGNKTAMQKLSVFNPENDIWEEYTIFNIFKNLVSKKIFVANKYYFKSMIDNKCLEVPKIVLENIDLQKVLLEFIEQNNYFINFGLYSDNLEEISNETTEQNTKQNKIKDFCLLLREKYEIDDKTIYDINNFILHNLISIICLEEELLDYKKYEEVNVPWVITNFELNEGRVLKDFCNDYSDVPRSLATKTKIEQIRNYDQYLAHFLYRLVDESFLAFKVEPAYDSYNNSTRYNGYDNMYLDARLYLHASRRSILTVTDNNFSKPGSYFLPTLFDLCEGIHTRWQAMIAINIILDNYIRVFANHKIDQFSPSEKLKIIMRLLKKSLASLENPINYVVSGDTLRELHDKLVETFKIEELENNSLKKIEFLEKIYSVGISINSMTYQK